MKRPWAFICASEGATSKHLRNYCREVYLLGYLPVCPKLQDSQYLVLEDAMERSEYTAIVRDMLYLLHEAPPEEQNFPMVMEMIAAAEVHEDDDNYQSPLDILFERLEMREPDSIACKQYRIFKQAAGVVCSKRLLNQAVGKSLRTHNLKPKKGAQVMRKNEKITALYERLSRDDFGKDDDQQRESNSISNQKAMLEEFAARQGFTNLVHFTDDGISGTCFVEVR